MNFSQKKVSQSVPIKFPPPRVCVQRPTGTAYSLYTKGYIWCIHSVYIPKTTQFPPLHFFLQVHIFGMASGNLPLQLKKRGKERPNKHTTQRQQPIQPTMFFSHLLHTKANVTKSEEERKKERSEIKSQCRVSTNGAAFALSARGGGTGSCSSCGNQRISRLFAGIGRASCKRKAIRWDARDGERDNHPPEPAV